jgi:hypothetical protein
MKIFHLSLSLPVVFGGLIGLAVLVGYGLPPASAVQQLHLSDCAPPCWIGIVPGDTSIEDAVRRFSAIFAPVTHVSTPTLTLGTTTNPWVVMPLLVSEDAADRLMVQLGSVEGIVNRIMMQGRRYGPVNTMPRLGDVVRLLGTPSCVNPQTPSFEGWTLYYHTPYGTIQVGVLGRNSLVWTQPVYFIYLRATAEDADVCSVAQPWRGVYRSRYKSSS